ncbi:MAG: hypothetical protein HUK19_09890 [Fibrobacter sp.]|nr:hypothetical protein [Fibrobacter sp.]
MRPIYKKNYLEVIEVPPELRGLSDEEIIANSEKQLRQCSGKRKNGARRPSKKTRIALKQQKELDEINQAAAELFTCNAQLTNRSFSETTRECASSVARSSTARPSTARVLKATFGIKKAGNFPK